MFELRPFSKALDGLCSCSHSLINGVVGRVLKKPRKINFYKFLIIYFRLDRPSLDSPSNRITNVLIITPLFQGKVYKNKCECQIFVLFFK